MIKYPDKNLKFRDANHMLHIIILYIPVSEKKNVNTLNFYKYLMYIGKICNEKIYMESLIQNTNANRMVKYKL